MQLICRLKSHERDICFHRVNLENVLMSVSALLIVLIYYYQQSFSKVSEEDIDMKTTVFNLQPISELFRCNSEHYYEVLYIH